MTTPLRGGRRLLGALALAAPPAFGQAPTTPPVDEPPLGQSASEIPLGVGLRGEIERPALPADIAHPSRWRYIPPGRVIEGGMFDRFLTSTFFSPVLFRDADVGTGGGVAVTDIDFRNNDYREFANLLLTYTTEGQTAAALNWRRWTEHRVLPNGGVIREERNGLFAEIERSKTLTRRFFGFGGDTLEGDETSYTDLVTNVGFGARSTWPDVASDWMLFGGVQYRSHELSRGRVRGAPSTDDVFPRVFADGESVHQGWLNLSLAYDTRDSLHQPHSGFRAGVGNSAALVQSDGHVGGKLSFDAQYVAPTPPLFHVGGSASEENPPTDVVVFAGFVSGAYGDIPFYDLPSLGGSRTLRGYIDNRFVDRVAAHGSIEYRFDVFARGVAFRPDVRIERVSLALFYDMGAVASSFDRLDDARFLDSYGFGLRLSMAREALFRLDYGLSDESSNFTISFGYAF